MVAAKTANAKLESEVKQEKGNAHDLTKMLAYERNVMSTMDVEHQQQLVELEQRHQEKVLLIFTLGPIRSYSYKIQMYLRNHLFYVYCVLFYSIGTLPPQPAAE